MKMYQKKIEKKSKLSLLQKIKHRIVFILLRKEVKNMAVVYATLIIKDKYTFVEVPEKVKPQVKQILIEMDLPELAE